MATRACAALALAIALAGCALGPPAEPPGWRFYEGLGPDDLEHIGAVEGFEGTADLSANIPRVVGYSPRPPAGLPLTIRFASPQHVQVHGELSGSSTWSCDSASSATRADDTMVRVEAHERACTVSFPPLSTVDERTFLRFEALPGTGTTPWTLSVEARAGHGGTSKGNDG